MRGVIHILGLDDGNSAWYLWWSGIGADLGELTLIAVVYHHLNCHAEGYWRPARHQMGGYCRRHRARP